MYSQIRVIFQYIRTEHVIVCKLYVSDDVSVNNGQTRSETAIRFASGSNGGLINKVDPVVQQLTVNHVVLRYTTLICPYEVVITLITSLDFINKALATQCT